MTWGCSFAPIVTVRNDSVNDWHRFCDAGKEKEYEKDYCF